MNRKLRLLLIKSSCILFRLPSEPFSFFRISHVFMISQTPTTNMSRLSSFIWRN